MKGYVHVVAGPVSQSYVAPVGRVGTADFVVNQLHADLRTATWHWWPILVHNPIGPSSRRIVDSNFALWPVLVALVGLSATRRMSAHRAARKTEKLSPASNSSGTPHTAAGFPSQYWRQRRRQAGWALMVILVVLVLLTCASVWYMPSIQAASMRREVVCRIGYGVVQLNAQESMVFPGEWLGVRLSIDEPFHLGWSWWPPISLNNSAAAGRRSYGSVGLRTWFAGICLAIPALWLIRANRKFVQAENACRACGYSLLGLAPNSPCPECGKSPPPPSAPVAAATPSPAVSPIATPASPTPANSPNH